MKYIKKYENINNKYKKYLVLYGNSVLDKEKVIWVCENFEEYLSDYWYPNYLMVFKMLFKYKNNEIVYLNKDKKSAGIDEIEKELIYQSNNLNEIKEMLPSLYNSQKYNL